MGGGGGGGGCSGERAARAKNSLCLCRERRERERARLWQSNSVVVSASRIDLEPSPALNGPSLLRSLLSLLRHYNLLFMAASCK